MLKFAKVRAPGLDGTAYRVMYLSESVQNKPVPVTGLVVVPNRPAPAGGYPVVSWAHDTNGIAVQCAPSLQPTSIVSNERAPSPWSSQANRLLDQGWEIAATDYEGEGTPGPLPYMVGESAARNTIDAVRATRQMQFTHASSHYVVWGHSEGGHTALFTLHIAGSYAPDVHLEGVVAGAPGSQFNLAFQYLQTTPYWFLALMIEVGFNAAYGNQAAPLSEVLTPKGFDVVPTLFKGCLDYLYPTLTNLPHSDVSKADPSSLPDWRRLVLANDPQSFATASGVPLLIIQGGADEQVPAVSTQILASHLCGVGQNLERWIYPDRSHTGVIQVSVSDMIRWISDRFARQANPDPYRPSGQAGIQFTSCPGL